MNVVYRDAAGEDAQALADFWRETFVATFGALYPVADLKHFIAGSYLRSQIAAEIFDLENFHQLALHGDGIVGAVKVGAFKLPHEPDVAKPLELHRLYVAAEAKGTGVADALMNWAKTRAKGEGAQALYLGVYQGNERAQRFYARHGFSIVGEYLFEVGETRDPEYIMRSPI